MPVHRYMEEKGSASISSVSIACQQSAAVNCQCLANYINVVYLLDPDIRKP